MRTQLRKALPEDLRWATPHSFRRTVATVINDSLGGAAAQHQPNHRKLSTTETFYFEPRTTGPDACEVLDRFAADEESGEVGERGG